MRGLEILEKIENGLKNGKIGLRSADIGNIGRYGPTLAETKIFIGKIFYLNKKAHSAGNRAVTVSK